MNDPHHSAADDERYRVRLLIRRLFLEQGLVHWPRYAIAFLLMAVAAGCTAFSAYLIGDVINQAYVNKSLSGIIILGAITVALFAAKGLATYGHSVMLSRIGNRIVANNQRAVFAKLHTGDVAGARRLLRTLADRSERGAGDLRSQLLDAYVTKMEKARGLAAR